MPSSIQQNSRSIAIAFGAGPGEVQARRPERDWHGYRLFEPVREGAPLGSPPFAGRVTCANSRCCGTADAGRYFTGTPIPSSLARNSAMSFSKAGTISSRMRLVSSRMALAAGPDFHSWPAISFMLPSMLS